MKRKRVFTRHRDVNAERLFKAGQLARDANQFFSACPSLPSMSENRHAALTQAWKSGWLQRNAELVKERSNRHAMKGSD